MKYTRVPYNFNSAQIHDVFNSMSKVNFREVTNEITRNNKSVLIPQ